MKTIILTDKTASWLKSFVEEGLMHDYFEDDPEWSIIQELEKALACVPCN